MIAEPTQGRANKERRPNRAGKPCAQCGVVPPLKMSHGVCPDCAAVNASVRAGDRYERDREARLAGARAYHRAHRDAILARQRAAHRRTA
jgi:hypothetical protein